ncbi:uncharacterized protein BX664DRAFT_339957 [Halteromyces radiatus]|uniref:uncharacterized protein n=1 Tax=Halteromyces radiatus TaxID=101107 RepID=UPI00221E474A|nr:uncharacterized protein BX664DRAFT_339957 [Halteromyces radiatus]KAI8083171.1 hypothetical protein BX664DRAFT_339957 [Halteromyces radiatus]
MSTHSPNKTSESLWKETKTPEGRIYWYNTSTRQTTWKKPEVLWTEEEIAINQCPWKEYTTPEGKKYYSHKETKQTTWQIPEAYQELLSTLKRIKETTIKPSSSGSPSTIVSPMSPVTASPPVNQTSTYYNKPTISATSASLLLSQPPDIKVDSPEKAMEQFHLLLKSKGVRPDWSWEETMRAIITDPRYRVFKTISERKSAFQLYINQEAQREREEKENQEKKERNDFYAMLERIPQIKSYSSYRTVLPLFANMPAFQQVTSDRQRQNLFHDYIHQLRRSEKEQLRKTKKTSIEAFKHQISNQFDVQDITLMPKWKDIYQQYVLPHDDTYKGMTQLDFLEVYQDYYHDKWKKPLAEYHERLEQQQHQDRLARDAFKQLLKSLHQEGIIHVRSQWKNIYPFIENDTRYTNLLGVPSSTPLDLFWDYLDDLDQDLYDQRKIVQDYLKQHDERITLETSLEEYQDLLAKHPSLLNQIEPNNIPLIYQEIQKRELRKQQEAERKQQRKLQKKIKNLRHAIRKLDQPPLQANDTWDMIEPRLQNNAAYLELEQDDDAKLEAFRQALARLTSEQQNTEVDEDDDNEYDEEDDNDEEGMIRE